MAAPNRSPTSDSPMPGTAGLILAGGRSSRMGMDKAQLRFGPDTLLELALRRMSEVARPLAVSVSGSVAMSAPGGQASAVRNAPPDLLWVRDRAEYPGPLWGMAEGFRVLAGRAERVLLMPVDLPFYTGDWMRRALVGLEGHRACLYRWQGFTNALVGAYDLRLLPKLERLVAEQRRRPMDLVQDEPVRVLEVESLWEQGQGAPPLMDTDTPEDYRQALLLGGWGHAAGAPVTVELLGAAGALLGRVPLFASTLPEVTAVLAQLYPELKDTVLKDTVLKDAEVMQSVARQQQLTPGQVLRMHLAGNPGARAGVHAASQS